MNMKWCRVLAVFVFVMLLIPAIAIAEDEPNDVLEFDTTSYGTYIEVRKAFGGDSADESNQDRPLVDGVTVSVSRSNEWTETRVNVVKELGGTGISVGAAVRHTMPDSSVIEDETQLGAIVQYHKSYAEGKGDFVARAEAFYGTEGKSGFRHIEAHLINSHWWGVAEQTVRLGHVVRGTYVSDPLGYGEFDGGNWDSKTRTTDLGLDLIFKINQRSLEPFVAAQFTRVKTTGEATTDAGVFPFWEDQKITRLGIGLRQYHWFNASERSIWWRVFLGHERIDDTNGPFADHSGAYVGISAGFSF